MLKLTLIFCFVFLKISEQRSSPQDDSYVAAVLEYEVTTDMDLNLQNYVRYIQQAADQNADIVVFPEMTLTRGSRSIPVPIHGLLKEHPIPAQEPELFDEMLVALSRAARQHEIYVVVNIQEVMDCADAPGEYCPEAKTYLFNTNVVFDRTGAVIDRFRKINLFGEFTRTPALQPDLGIFSTDFGVTFGHFICFDLMFQVPSIQIVQKHNLTDVVFTTMWFSEMPYLSATQIQEAYSYSMNVNFLASGANNVRVGSAGSGIYSGKAGALVSIMPGVPTTRLLVARVPKVPGQVTEVYPGPIYDNPKDHDGLVLISDPSLPSHVTRLLVPGHQEFTLVDKDVSCKFRVNLSYKNGETNYRYRAGAFSGVRSFSGLGTGGARVCSVFACSGNSIDNCTKRYPEYVGDATGVFEELDIVASVPTPVIDTNLDADNSAFFPVSLQESIMPLEPDEYSYSSEEHGTETVFSLTLNNHEAKLYSFAIWGRVFATDGQEASPPVPNGSPDSSIRLFINYLLTPILLILLR